MIKNLQKLIFLISPILKFEIDGKSMEPKFKKGEIIFVNRFFYFFKNPKIKDIVALKDPLNKARYIIKYISKIKREKYFVLGFNLKNSIDSRSFGWVEKKYIIGKVI